MSVFTPLVISCVLAALAAMVSVYIGLSSGITPNLSLVGVFAAALFARQWAGNGITTRDSLNLIQTGTSAANSIASGLVFTLPALILVGQGESLPWLHLSLVAMGGAAFGLLIVLFMIRRTATSSLQTSPEAEALVALIRQMTTREDTSSRSNLRRDSWSEWPLALGLLGGLIAGIAVGLRRDAFAIELTEHSALDLGLNPAWIALGIMIGVGTAKGIFVGGMLKICLLGLVIGVAVGNEGLLRTSGRMISGSASLVLGIAAILTVGTLVFRLARIPEGSNATNIQARVHIPRHLLVLMSMATLLGLAALAFLSATGQSSLERLFVPGLCLIVAVAAAVLAERAVSIAGVTMNPSSSMGLLVGAGFALCAVSELSPLVVGFACFVVCATSASADLAQDLCIGRRLGTSMDSQIAYKWWGLLLGTPLASVLIFILLRNSDGLAKYNAPQSHALVEIFDIAAIKGPFIATVAAAAIMVGLATRTAPILIGIGLLVGAKLSIALLLGAMAGQFVEGGLRKRLSKNHPPNGTNGDYRSTEDLTSISASVVLAPVLAAVLGSFAIGAALSFGFVNGEWDGARTLVHHVLEIASLLLLSVAIVLSARKFLKENCLVENSD